MPSNIARRAGAILNRVYLACAIIFLALLTHHHFMLITHEVPLDYNEAGMLIITGTIADGGNPFSLENQPSKTSVYPILYNLIVAPAAAIFDNSLLIHRLAAALFIVACCVICFLLCRKGLVSRIDSVVASSLLYAALLFYSTPIASPNGPGLFLFLSAIAIPYLCGFSKRTMAVALGCGILAYYTKQYFLASLGYLAVYIFLAISKKQSILFGFSALSLLLMSICFVSYTSPYFLSNTILAMQSGAKIVADYNHTFSQFTAYLQIYYPLLAIPLVVAASNFYESQKLSVDVTDGGLDKHGFNFFAIDKPFLSTKPDYMLVCMICSILIISFSLGSNPGNHLTYLMQLMTPFFLVSVFSVACKAPRWRQVFVILIILMMYKSYNMLATDLSVNEKNWVKIRRYIDAADDIYASTLVLPEIVKKGGPIYADGHTRYFPLGGAKSDVFVENDSAETVEAIWERHVRSIEQKILNQEFDLILMDQWMSMPASLIGSDVDPTAALQNNYKKTDILILPLAQRPGGGHFRMEIYEPIGKVQNDSY